jgi:hypothetical protein
MSFNYSGIPIGSALTGALATRSMDATVLSGVLVSLLAGVIALAIIPKRANM